MAIPKWKFYAQRPVSGEWLDTDVQLADCSLTYGLSMPNSGQLTLNVPDVEPFGDDGKPVWGKWNTLFYAEKNGTLDSAYIVDSVAPSPAGAQIKLIGVAGWLMKVEYAGVYQVWQTNTFDAVREFLSHANGKPRGLHFEYPTSRMSATTVGDVEPPPKPRKPPRHKGEKKSEYEDSDRFKAWQDDMNDWQDTWGDNEKYKVVFWESPFVGDVINNLANENTFDWREQFRWVSGPKDPEFTFNFADDLTSTRTDIVIEDGVNVVGRLMPSDDDQTYVNRVLGVGAGQGRKTRRTVSTVDDGRLYAAGFYIKKHEKNKKQLQRASDRSVKRRRKIDPQIGTVNVYDIDGYASAETLVPGNIVAVRSTFVHPHLDTMALITSKTVNPLNPGTVQFELETQAPA